MALRGPQMGPTPVQTCPRGCTALLLLRHPMPPGFGDTIDNIRNSAGRFARAGRSGCHVELRMVSMVSPESKTSEHLRALQLVPESTTSLRGSVVAHGCVQLRRCEANVGIVGEGRAGAAPGIVRGRRPRAGTASRTRPGAPSQGAEHVRGASRRERK